MWCLTAKKAAAAPKSPGKAPKSPSKPTSSKGKKAPKVGGTKWCLGTVFAGHVISEYC